MFVRISWKLICFVAFALITGTEGFAQAGGGSSCKVVLSSNGCPAPGYDACYGPLRGPRLSPIGASCDSTGLSRLRAGDFCTMAQTLQCCCSSSGSGGIPLACQKGESCWNTPFGPITSDSSNCAPLVDYYDRKEGVLKQNICQGSPRAHNPDGPCKKIDARKCQ